MSANDPKSTSGFRTFRRHALAASVVVSSALSVQVARATDKPIPVELIAGADAKGIERYLTSLGIEMLHSADSAFEGTTRAQAVLTGDGYRAIQIKTSEWGSISNEYKTYILVHEYGHLGEGAAQRSAGRYMNGMNVMEGEEVRNFLHHTSKYLDVLGDQQRASELSYIVGDANGRSRGGAKSQMEIFADYVLGRETMNMKKDKLKAREFTARGQYSRELATSETYIQYYLEDEAKRVAPSRKISLQLIDPQTGAPLVDTVDSSCFVAGTAVETEHGPRAIESVLVGERVWSTDETTGERVLRPVTHTYARHADATRDVFVRRADGAVERITTTDEHPFYVKDRGWVGAGELRPENALVSLEGNPLRVASVESNPVAATVYNLEVEGAHTYHVGASHVLVHNTCGPRATTRPRLGLLASASGVLDLATLAGHAYLDFAGTAKSLGTFAAGTGAYFGVAGTAAYLGYPALLNFGNATMQFLSFSPWLLPFKLYGFLDVAMRIAYDGKLGASDIPTIIGVALFDTDPYATPPVIPNPNSDYFQ